MTKILLIAREPFETLTSCLKRNDFDVEHLAPDRAGTSQLRQFSCNLILCEEKAITRNKSKSYIRSGTAPILWLVQQDELPRTIHDFCLGREDYLVLPAAQTILLAKVRMLLHCTGIEPETRLRVGSLSLDAKARVVMADGLEIPLTRREFDLLYGFLSAPEKAFTRKELMQQYWEPDSTAGPRAVDVYITKLREKFSFCHDFQIVTVHGVGYKAVLTK